MKRLIKGEWFDSGSIDGVEIATYINPTSKEIAEIKNSNQHLAVRGVIYDNGDIIAWNGNIVHISINSLINNNIDIENTFRFSVENEVMWIFDGNRMRTTDEAKKLIIKYADKLAEFGDIYNGMLFLCFHSDLETLTWRFDDSEILVAKRLIKKGEWVDSIPFCNSTLSSDDTLPDYEEIPIFKNPSNKEIAEVKNNSNNHYKSLRGVIYPDGTVYIWDGRVLHDLIANTIDITNSFRFAIESDGVWIFDGNGERTVDETKQLIDIYYNILSRFGTLDGSFLNLHYHSDSDFEDWLYSDEKIASMNPVVKKNKKYY